MCSPKLIAPLKAVNGGVELRLLLPCLCLSELCRVSVSLHSAVSLSVCTLPCLCHKAVGLLVSMVTISPVTVSSKLYCQEQ